MSSPSLNSLLQTTDAAKLCDDVFCLLAKRFGNVIDINRESEPSRTATLVWHSMGIICNGGFHYLFEGNFEGDLGFIYTAASFKRIGAHQAYSAFQNALALFPRSTPPEDMEHRLEIYESHGEDVTSVIDRQFLAAEHEIDQCLGQYIRDNAAGIEKVLNEIED